MHVLALQCRLIYRITRAVLPGRAARAIPQANNLARRIATGDTLLYLNPAHVQGGILRFPSLTTSNNGGPRWAHAVDYQSPQAPIIVK